MVGRAPSATGTVRRPPTIRMTADEMRDAAMACRAYAYAREKEAAAGANPGQAEILRATQRRHEELAKRFDRAAAIAAEPRRPPVELASNAPKPTPLRPRNSK